MDISEIKKVLFAEDINEKIEILSSFGDILDSYNKNIPMLDEIIQFLVDVLKETDDLDVATEILETICSALIFQEINNVNFDNLEKYICSAPEKILPRIIDALGYTHDRKYVNTIRNLQFHNNDQVRNSAHDAMKEMGLL